MIYKVLTIISIVLIIGSENIAIRRRRGRRRKRLRGGVEPVKASQAQGLWTRQLLLVMALFKHHLGRAFAKLIHPHLLS